VQAVEEVAGAAEVVVVVEEEEEEEVAVARAEVAQAAVEAWAEVVEEGAPAAEGEAAVPIRDRFLHPVV
jgi:hypothetical protein